MAIKIKQTSDVKTNGVKVIVYGGAGSGKTRLAASAPKPIIISSESGLLSLADVDVPYVEINTLNELKAAYKELKDCPDYETICLDSLSDIAEDLIVDYKKSVRDGRQAYGLLVDDLMPLLKQFRDIKGKHIVYTVKMIRIVDEESGKVSEDLFLPGKVLGNQLPYLVDELFKLTMSKKSKKFMIQTAPDRLSYAKDRSGALEAEEEPDMSAIIEKIMRKVS